MKCVAIIPARLSSSRIKEKPLVDVGGKPLIRRVWENAIKLKNVSEVVVAADSEKVMEVMKDAGCFLTPVKLSSGSDRVYWTANKYYTDADIIVNLQGDEPFIDTEMVDELINLTASCDAGLCSAYFPVSAVTAMRSDVVKVVVNKNDEALYFSRSPIPFKANIYNKHIGVYVWKREMLEKFHRWGTSPLEKIEGLEQLRILENGHKIKMLKSPLDSLGIDTYEDISLACKGHY